jgi:hypothetical protein
MCCGSGHASAQLVCTVPAWCVALVNNLLKHLISGSVHCVCDCWAYCTCLYDAYLVFCTGHRVLEMVHLAFDFFERGFQLVFVVHVHSQ